MTYKRVLPSKWELTTLEEVCNFYAGFAFPKDMQGRSGNELPFYKVKDVSVAWNANSKILLNTDHSLSHLEARTIKANPLPSEVIVFAKIGEALRLNRRAMTQKPALIDNNLMGIQGHPGGVNSHYLYWFSTITNFDSEARASVIPSIRKSDIANLKFPLPPFDEQTRIVEKLEELLSDLDAGVAELKAAQKKLVQYRQSLLKAAVEGALTAEWRKHNPPQETGAQLLERILKERRARWEAKQLAKFAEQGKAPPKGWKDKYAEPVKPDITNLPQLPDEWVWASLDQLSSMVRNGLSQKPSTDPIGYPILRINAVRPLSVNLDEVRYLSLDNKEVADYLLDEGDLLVTRYNGSVDLLGVAGVVRGLTVPTVHPDKLIRIKPVLKSVLADWIEICAAIGETRKHVVSRVKTTAGQTGISGEDVKKMPIPLAPFLEQSMATEIVGNAMREVIEQGKAIEFLLAKSSAQRKNILKAAFSGQLVPQDPNDEPASVLLERIRTERAARDKQPKPRKTRAVREAA